jgi:small ubiquitin-related modifier
VLDHHNSIFCRFHHANSHSQNHAHVHHPSQHIIKQTGEETFFKIKKTTKMTKVFANYASRKGVQPDSIRFLLDGERIPNDATPESLDLEDQDQIDCMLEQTGGQM